MKAPKHHPEEALLLDYATGSAPEAFSLVIATHLALCVTCRQTVSKIEAIGGAMFADLPERPVSLGALQQVEAQLDRTDRFGGQSQSPSNRPDFPRPLGTILGSSLDELHFKEASGIGVYPIKALSPYKAYLIRFAGNVTVPEHGHSGTELVLILQGGYSDAGETFEAGDFGSAEEGSQHAPVTGPEGCLCLCATKGEVRMSDPAADTVARWFGI